MTPEQVWRALSGHTEHGPVHEAEAIHIIRAALRERDAEWRVALLDALGAGMFLGLFESRAPSHAPLRALLEEAGRNG